MTYTILLKRASERSVPKVLLGVEIATEGGNPLHPCIDEDDFRNPLYEEIRRACLPRGMEKPPTLDLYDGTTDPNEHIQNIEVVMDYHVVWGSIKCRIFPTTLKKGYPIMGGFEESVLQQLHGLPTISKI